MINPQKLTKAQQAKFERKTLITWNELEDEATYMTASPEEWRKMDSKGIEPFRQTEYDLDGATLTFEFVCNNPKCETSGYEVYSTQYIETILDEQ